MSKYKIPQGVYFLYDNGQLVYIGQTNDIFRRISEHSRGMVKKGQPIKQFDDWAYIECDDEQRRLALEALLIHLTHPKYNDDIPTERSIRSAIDVLQPRRPSVRVADLREYALEKTVL